MKKMIALFISGGGNKITFLLGACLYLIIDLGITFGVYVGVSSGSILSLFFAIASKFPEILDEGKEKILNQKTSDILKERKGFFNKFVVFYRLISNYYLYDDSNLKKTIKSIVTKEKFEAWQKDKKTSDCIIVFVDPETNGETEEETEIHLDLRTTDYETAIRSVMASSAIPIAVKPKKVFKDVSRLFYDGGLESHNGSAKYVRKNYKKLSEAFSVYSRPEFRWQMKTQLPKLRTMKIFGKAINLPSFVMLKLISNVIYPILMFIVSKDDEILTDELLDYRKIKHTKIFAPHKLTEDPYEMNLVQNHRLYTLGRRQSKKSINKK